MWLASGVRSALRSVSNGLAHSAVLDVRSLACFRMGIAAVLLYDISLAWSVIDTWPAMMGYFDGLAAARAVGLDDSAFLYAALGVYALLALGLLLGWHARLCALGAWLALTAHRQWAGVIDYHDDVLFHALFCALFVETSACWSLDRRVGRGAEGADLIARFGGLGLVINTGFIYLSTVWEKDGAAWISEGTAVYYALRDVALSGSVGLWVVEHAPLTLLQAATYAVWFTELAGGLALLLPRTRFVGWVLLTLLQVGLGLMLALESFPATMLALQVALVPGRAWERLGVGVHRASPLPRPLLHRTLLWALLAAIVLLNVEGRRLTRLDGEYWPYRGAEAVAELRQIFELETHWQMYAPTPPRYGGWWVCVGYTAAGEEVDPITGAKPHFGVPLRSRQPFRGLGSVYWFVEPRADGHPQDSYVRYIAWVDRHRRAPAQRMTHFSLFFVYEPFRPIQNAPHARKPLLILRWPEDGVNRPALRADSALRGQAIYRPDYREMGKSGWQPEALPPLETY